MDINVLDPSNSINDSFSNFDISQQSTNLDSGLPPHEEIQINTNCHKFPANSDRLLFHNMKVFIYYFLVLI